MSVAVSVIIAAFYVAAGLTVASALVAVKTDRGPWFVATGVCYGATVALFAAFVVASVFAGLVSSGG